MAERKITEVATVSTINDNDYLFVNQNAAVRQVRKADIPKPIYTAEEVGALPDTTTALPNPNALTFAGAVTGSYDGSKPMTVNIPAGGSGGTSTVGEDGGYYTPSVDAEGNLTWTASKTGMPAIAGANIKGPKGDAGASGATPQRGVDYWTDADKAEIKSYVDDAILGGAW